MLEILLYDEGLIQFYWNILSTSNTDYTVGEICKNSIVVAIDCFDGKSDWLENKMLLYILKKFSCCLIFESV